MKKIIIIGGGAAGCEAAFAARKNSPQAQITVFAAENYPPYRRPVLPGTLNAPPSNSFWLKQPDIYKENVIDLKINEAVASVNIADHTVTDDCGNNYFYDVLCFATGAKPRFPQVAGVGLEGVFGCRTYDDFQKISSELQPGVSAVVIGGGVLGLEVASAMIKSKAHVTVLEYAPRLLHKQLSSTASVVLEKMIKNSAGNSIDILCGAVVVAIEGAAGKVSAVVLADGRRIPCSVVIAAMGVVPDTRLAQNAGLNVGPRGIVIDSSCRCCGYDEIFACGDCAAFDNFNPGLFAVAQQQGQIVGNNMTGGCAEFTVSDVPVRLPAFGIKMLSIGEIIETDAVESLPEDNAFFRGIYFKDGKCCGAVLLGDLNGQNNIAEMVKNKTEKTVALKEGGLL